MTTEQVSRQDFEEALREDEIQQPDPIDAIFELCKEHQEKEFNRLLGSSCSDCAITMENEVASDPAEALRTALRTLLHMNQKGIQKKAHRQALVRAGRKALGKIGEL
jgi:hypothetical protein